MALNAQNVEKGLLANNFFPRVAKRGDEFPPCFVSTGFTPDVASKLIAPKIKRSNGYGVISARSTRFDLAPRNVEIVHPRAFAATVRDLRIAWNEWQHVTNNQSSAIRVAEHGDGRVFSMRTQGDVESLNFPAGRFRVVVDVTNFYSSIYTHSIPWAVYGLHAAKAGQRNSSDWANRLDWNLRQGRRKETTGISIGPGTSGIVGEVLMNRIDENLRGSGYEFLRYIDDFYFVSESRDRAESFVKDVRQQLATFKLAIHPGKTTITELPTPVSPRWVREMRSALRGRAGTTKMLDALDQAVESFGAAPEDGVLRYALVAIEDQLINSDFSEELLEAVVNRLMNLAFLRPIAVGTVCRLLAAMEPGAVQARAVQLDRMLREHATTLRTDATTWLLNTMLANGIEPTVDAAEAIAASGDCMALTLLATYSDGYKEVKRFMRNLKDEDPPDYRRDEYWLLYYQLALAGKRGRSVPEEYYDDLQPLLDAGVSFVDLGAQNPYTASDAEGPDEPTRYGGGGGGGGGPYAD